MAAFAAKTLRIAEVDPFGDVTIVPPALTGRTDMELAHAMAADLISSNPESDADALRHLRQSFPDAPLTVRVAALAALMRR